MLHFLRKNRKLTTHTGYVSVIDLMLHVLILFVFRTHYILSALVTYSFASGLATSIGALLTLIVSIWVAIAFWSHALTLELNRCFSLFPKPKYTVLSRSYCRIVSPPFLIASSYSLKWYLVYSNSVLSLLNARQAIREKASSSHVSSSVLSSRALGPLRFKKQRRQEQVSIFPCASSIRLIMLEFSRHPSP